MSIKAAANEIVERLAVELDGFTRQTYNDEDATRTVFIRENTRVVVYGWKDGLCSWHVDHWDPDRSWITCDSESQVGTMGPGFAVGSILVAVEKIGAES